MDRLMVEFAVAVAAGAVMFSVLVLLLKRKAAQVGEEEVSRRIQQGYRAQAATGVLLVAGIGLGALVGSLFGEGEAGGLVGFGLAAIGAIAYGVQHDRAKRRSRGG